MRSTIVAAAFAAGALAVPYNHQHQHKRQAVDVVTDSEVEVVYATDVVTVTAAAEAPAATTTEEAPVDWRTHWSWGGYTSEQETTTSEAAPTSTYVAPTSTYTPPAPTTTSTSVYVAPTTSAESSSAPASSPATTAAPTSAAPSTPTTYSETVIYHHNIHRKNHTAPPVAWSDSLASIAQSIGETCIYEHNVTAGGGGFGQNIAAGVESNNISAVITDLMYNGEVGWYNGLYDQAQPDMTNFEHWGHFSQIVWKGTTHVGCATVDCSAAGLANTGSDVAPYFTVCNYESPGNYANEYGDNVLSPLGYPTAQWNTGL